MTRIVDARGLACPQPVILTRRAMAEPDGASIVTIVDNETARHNVSRMAAKAGYRVEVEERGDDFYLHLSKEEVKVMAAPQPAVAPAEPAAGPLVLVVPGDRMGRGPEELGAILIRAFFHTLGEVEPQPDVIIFFNEGVKLVVEGSPVLEDVQALAESGVEILACGTCLGFFELKEKVAVGEVSNMYTIAETMLRAGKVVSL
ncbi:MAG: sulfurtransferase-like selenium metabolism protein YedF [Anaerolineae bacterium]|nr:sulfurtransferase-like selenium metabolism protein YedF [Anaerolineae bacterium]